jgi:energy-coupling factor transporter ATP-binding protein EcfA2
VDDGEIFGILGPNGAGKTTTVECVEGLQRPDSGAVRVLGLDPQADGLGLSGWTFGDTSPEPTPCWPTPDFVPPRNVSAVRS